MCGINGFNFRSEELIQSMNQSLTHRGPDGRSYYVQDDLSLGHARLSIIDLSDAGTQPMDYTHKGLQLSIIFNGEIYNYIELKETLTQLGYPFHSHSDTEVIMAAYLEWGEECVQRFNGMWSICLYDKQQQKLFCSRDRLGVKPFYYYNQDKKFVFSSELKSILKHTHLNITREDNINRDAVALYFSLGYIPAPATIYKNVFKLRAAHNLVFDLRTSEIERMYAYFSAPKKSDSGNRSELVEEGKYLLRDSVKLRMRSDVPVGAFLSGGLDSSTVVGEMRHFCDLQNLHTFSIGFDDPKLDESAYINLVKDHFGTQHHHHIYNEADFTSTWDRYADIFDEPFGDYSAFPAFKVCNMARQQVTVSLSGDGGDEIFGGYPIYNTGYILDRVRKMPAPIARLLQSITGKLKNGSGYIAKVNEVLRLSLHDKKDFHAQMFSEGRYKPALYAGWTTEKMKEALDLSGNDLAEALRIYDLLSNTLADNYLTKVDRTSMASSIEVRSPFLDFRFVAYAQKIPRSMKVNFRDNKILMRELIKDIVPREILTRSKMGFTPPIGEWLYRSITPEKFAAYKNYLATLDTELFNFYENIFRSGTKNYMHNFYMIKLAIFGKWYERWIIGIHSTQLPA